MYDICSADVRAFQTASSACQLKVLLSSADHQVFDVLCCMHSLLLPILLLLLLPQKLLRSAYQGALSYPLIPELEDLHHINSHVLSEFVAQHYTGMDKIYI
jgi:hypothetical protein